METGQKSFGSPWWEWQQFAEKKWDFQKEKKGKKMEIIKKRLILSANTEDQPGEAAIPVYSVASEDKNRKDHSYKVGRLREHMGEDTGGAQPGSQNGCPNHSGIQ